MRKTGADGYTNTNYMRPYIKFEGDHTGSFYTTAVALVTMDGKVTELEGTATTFPDLPANFDGYVLFDLDKVAAGKSGVKYTTERRGNKLISTPDDGSGVLTNSTVLTRVQISAFNTEGVEIGGIALVNMKKLTNPGTGSVSVLALAALAVASGTAFIASRKKKD